LRIKPTDFIQPKIFPDHLATSLAAGVAGMARRAASDGRRAVATVVLGYVRHQPMSPPNRASVARFAPKQIQCS